MLALAFAIVSCSNGIDDSCLKLADALKEFESQHEIAESSAFLQNQYVSLGSPTN